MTTKTIRAKIPKKKRSSKKKISSKDFLSLLDDQEASAEKPAFNPRLAAYTAKLTPVQKHWLEYALSKTPRFVTKWASKAVSHILKNYADVRR